MNNDIFANVGEIVEEDEAQRLVKQKKEQNLAQTTLASGVTEEKLLEKPSNRNKNVYKTPSDGFKNLPIENLPSKGIFYPAGTSISIRAAGVKEIRHYSTIDERDFLNVDDKLNHMMEKCTKVYMPNHTQRNSTGPKPISYLDLVEIDRIYIILAIRELTFLQTEQKITMNIECNHCGHSSVMDITKESIPSLDLSKLEKFIDAENQCFKFTFKSSGETMYLRLPTLGITNYTKNYARSKAYNNQYLDDSFLKILMYLDYDYRQLNDKFLRELDLDINTNWTKDKMSAISSLVETIDAAASGKLRHTCESCGQEVISELYFQKGWKSLFLYAETDVFDLFV